MIRVALVSQEKTSDGSRRYKMLEVKNVGSWCRASGHVTNSAHYREWGHECSIASQTFCSSLGFPCFCVRHSFPKFPHDCLLDSSCLRTLSKRLSIATISTVGPISPITLYSIALLYFLWGHLLLPDFISLQVFYVSGQEKLYKAWDFILQY